MRTLIDSQNLYKPSKQKKQKKQKKRETWHNRVQPQFGDPASPTHAYVYMYRYIDFQIFTCIYYR